MMIMIIIIILIVIVNLYKYNNHYIFKTYNRYKLLSAFSINKVGSTFLQSIFYESYGVFSERIVCIQFPYPFLHKQLLSI
jgi:hypothetical protein